jgi:hypothetical protein
MEDITYAVMNESELCLTRQAAKLKYLADSLGDGQECREWSGLSMSLEDIAKELEDLGEWITKKMKEIDATFEPQKAKDPQA